MQIVCIRECSSGNRLIRVGEKFRLVSSNNLEKRQLYSIKLYTLEHDFVTNVSDENTLCRYFEDVR